ncbi:hypothetical protein CYMTET_14262, partial [Cymbomonas tetramitiformis]
MKLAFRTAASATKLFRGFQTSAPSQRIYDNILQTIGSTPVVKINKLAPSGINLYAKCEFFNPLSSVKDRLAYAIIEDAERSGALKPGMTVVEATSGNTGIAVAMVCAQKGYPCVITMAETFSVERRKIMRALGAKVVLTPAALKGTGMVKKAEELAEMNGWFLCRREGAVQATEMPSKTYDRQPEDGLRVSLGMVSASQPRDGLRVSL